MALARLPAILALGAALFSTSLAHAQCAMDTECKGDRVCEEGQCVAPQAAAPRPAPSQAAAPAPSPALAVAPSPEAPKMQRHSKGMMVGGIVMVSLAPVAFVVAGFATLAQGLCEVGRSDDFTDRCDNSALIYGSLVTGFALVGAGVPLIVIGAKKEPVEASSATAVIAPWAARHAAGFALRIDL